MNNVYFIDSTVEYHSTFSGASWTEGYVAFISQDESKSRDIFKLCEEIRDKTLSDTSDHRSQIRGSWTDRTIIGIVQNATSYDDVNSESKIDILYHSKSNDLRKSTITNKIFIDTDIDIENFVDGLDDRTKIVKYHNGEFVSFKVK